MAQRRNAERGFIDAWTAELGGPRTSALLERLDNAIPWDALVEPVARLSEYREAEKSSRSAWLALTMLKCVMLANGSDCPIHNSRNAAGPALLPPLRRLVADRRHA